MNMEGRDILLNFR